MQAPESADASLAERIRHGDRSAETDFVRRFERGVRVLVRRHTRPGESMIDDFVQEVLWVVLERLRAGDLRDPDALPAYLRTTIVHVTTAEYRRRATRGETVSPESLERIPGGADPAEQVRTRQLALQMRALLAELPVARDREILARFYLEERSKDEVCAELGIDGDHFRRVVHRARERMRELLVRAGWGEP